VFRFGLFEADPDSGELFKQGEHVRLQDQPFRMLILLLQRPGEVVSREELREKLWPENTFVEFDNGLNVAAKKLRDALGDNADNPRFVETVPRRGYRFIAPVSLKTPAAVATQETVPAGQHSVPAPASPSTTDVAPQHHKGRRYLIVAGVAGVLAIAGALLVGQLFFKKPAPQTIATNSTPPSAVTLRRTVAVLEFQNVSRQSSDDWLSTAIAEMLTTELGAGERLHLVPAEDVSRMKRELHVGNSSSLARDVAVSAGKNLKADMLVVGSFTALGAGRNRRVRVDVRMQDSSNGDIVAEVAETADEQQLFELVSRAGTRLREALGFAGMTLAENTAARAALPSNPEAARLYAQGLARLHVLDAAGARDLLMQAVAAEPKFPLSHMALASAWKMLGYDQKAKPEARKGFDLSSKLPRGDRFLIEGRYYEISGEMDEAVSAYRALFALFPDSLEDGLILAEAQDRAGKPADALATIDALRKLPAPLSLDPRIDLRHAGVLMYEGNGKDAVLPVIRRAEEKAKAQGMPLVMAKARMIECSTLLFSAGMHEEAAQACEESQRAFAAAGNMADTAAAARYLGDIRLHQGRLAEALAQFQQALKIDQDAQNARGIAVSSNEIALVYESRGDLRMAEKFYRESYLWFLKAGHRKNASVLASNVGGILLLQGRFKNAEDILHRALALAHESGSKDPEVAVRRNLSELALLRGNFADALEKIQAIHNLDNQDFTGHVDDLERMGRVFAAQNDLGGARAHLLEAIGMAEKIGAKGQAAQSHLALAQLDLEEGNVAQAEQPIRNALETFRQEKMNDDQVQGLVTLSRCLLTQGKVKEAEAALAEGSNAVTHSQNPTIQLTFAIADARVKATRTGAPRTMARAELQRSIKEASNLGLVPLEFEAQLALGELELSENPATGQKSLESLEKRAHDHGLGLIARRAAAARTQNEKK
jgi:eukaryotic-like serine/threonine-protein kinase